MEHFCNPFTMDSFKTGLLFGPFNNMTKLETLLETFESEIQELRTARLSVLERANSGIDLCQRLLAKLRTLVVTEGFADRDAEVHFFKDIKTVPLGYLVYYTEVRKCELKLPKMGRKPKLKFLKGERERLNHFFRSHLEFHRYLQEGRFDRDRLYFTRNRMSSHPLREGYTYCYDMDFETSHDLLLATFKGMERYGNYLQELEGRLEALGSGTYEREYQKASGFTFTQSPTAAMEVIYALKLAKFIDHGDFEIKAFVEFFCRTFNMEIKDPYGLFKQISQRKTNRAKHLQRLVDALLNALDDRDGYIL